MFNQRDLSMATLWWINTGIYLKMKSDVDFMGGGSSAETSFWKPEYITKNIPLTINHLLITLIILGTGLILSTLIFFLELLCILYRKTVSSKEDGSISRSPKILGNREIQVLFEMQLTYCGAWHVSI